MDSRVLLYPASNSPTASRAEPAVRGEMAQGLGTTQDTADVGRRGTVCTGPGLRGRGVHVSQALTGVIVPFLPDAGAR